MKINFQSIKFFFKIWFLFLLGRHSALVKRKQIEKFFNINQDYIGKKVLIKNLFNPMFAIDMPHNSDEHIFLGVERVLRQPDKQFEQQFILVAYKVNCLTNYIFSFLNEKGEIIKYSLAVEPYASIIFSAFGENVPAHTVGGLRLVWLD